MAYRRTIFVLSLVAAVGLYALLLWFAPHILVLHARDRSSDIVARFRVQLSDSPAPRPAPALAEEVPASRPGSVRDLLTRDPSEVVEAPPPLAPADAPAQERLARLDAARAHDLAPDPAALARVDARILEISEAAARPEIEVARRLVRPSPEAVLPEGSAAVLRTPRAEGADALPLPADAIARSLLADAPISPGIAPPQGAAPPLPAEGSAAPAALTPSLPAPEVEQALARAPAERVAAEAREAHDYTFLDDLVDIRLETHEDPADPQGYFRLRILPRADRELTPLPKDVVFIVDTSQSIPQHKLATTARGVSEAVARLRPEDYFNVVGFKAGPTPFRDQPVPATPENKQAARDYLRALESGGATDFQRALTPTLAQVFRPGVPAILFVVSDGRPTTGLMDSRAIILTTTAENRLDHSIFAFGGGNTVNQYLLDLLAYQNRGGARVAATVADIEAGLPAFFGELDDPLLVGLQAEFGRIDTSEVYPRALPDFYRARPITIYGRFQRDAPGDFTMRLTGRAQDTRKELLFRAALDSAPRGDAQIAREWAFAKSYALIGEMAIDGETPERVEAIRALGDRYGIRTSYSP
jgi:hypothetical protein